MSEPIANPAAKAASAIVLGGGANVVAHAQGAADAIQRFWPHTATEWAAFISATMAGVYTVTVMTEWWWKRWWRPFMERKGWIQPLPRRARTRHDDVELDTDAAPL